MKMKIKINRGQLMLLILFLVDCIWSITYMSNTTAPLNFKDPTGVELLVITNILLGGTTLLFGIAFYIASNWDTPLRQ